MKTKIMKRKILLPLLAILLGVGGAFALTSKKPAATFYYVASVDGSDYVLTDTPPANCGAGTAQVCQISTDATPEDNRIPVSQATVQQRRP